MSHKGNFNYGEFDYEAETALIRCDMEEMYIEKLYQTLDTAMSLMTCDKATLARDMGVYPSELAAFSNRHHTYTKYAFHPDKIIRWLVWMGHTVTITVTSPPQPFCPKPQPKTNEKS
ncbi:MAG: hypothetical protein ACRCX2_34780 [Paraclostridium sp.]